MFRIISENRTNCRELSCIEDVLKNSKIHLKKPLLEPLYDNVAGCEPVNLRNFFLNIFCIKQLRGTASLKNSSIGVFTLNCTNGGIHTQIHIRHTL